MTCVLYSYWSFKNNQNLKGSRELLIFDIFETRLWMNHKNILILNNKNKSLFNNKTIYFLDFIILEIIINRKINS